MYKLFIVYKLKNNQHFSLQTLLLQLDCNMMSNKGLLCFLFLLLAAFAQAQSRDGYRLYGTITYDDVPLFGAKVYLHELQREVVTDYNGFYTFYNVKPGAYHLHINSPGYVAKRVNVTLKDTDRHVDIALERSSLRMDEVLVETNPFKSGPVDQSQTVVVVERENLERNSAETFVNALERIPGISSINTGVGIAKPVIRGMSFNRVMVNDRGIKQEGQQWGADHGLEIDPFDVDRVEIVKGPASLIYGSDAMGGVINILPGAIPASGEHRAHYIGGYRSNNHLHSHSAMIEGSEGAFFYKARITTQDYGNYRIPANDFVYAGFRLPVYNQMLTNTAGRERHASAAFGLRKQWGFTKLTVSRFYQEVGLFPGAIGIPTSYALQHKGEFRNVDLPFQENEHLKLISNTNVQIGKHWMEVDLGYQRNHRVEHSHPHAHGQNPRPEGFTAMDLDLHTLTSNLRFHHIINGRYKAIYGMQLQYMSHDYSGFEFLVPAYSSFLAGVFSFQEFRVNEAFVINAGARYDGALHDIKQHLQPVYRFREPTGEFDERNPDVLRSFGNSSGSVGFSWLPNERLNVKLNMGSSYRIPTAVELSVNGVHHGNFRHELGNADLQGERGVQADLNVTYKNKQFFASITPFVSHYDQYIYLAPTGRFSTLPGSGTLWEYRQNDAYFVGIESMVNAELTKGLEMSVGLEYVQNQNLDTKLPLPLTPPLSILSSLEYHRNLKTKWMDSWYASVDIRWANAQTRTDRNERSTDGYTIVGASFGGEVRLWSHPIVIRLRGVNLTDAFYLNHLSRYRLLNLPEQGRNISVQLKIPLDITSNAKRNTTREAR